MPLAISVVKSVARGSCVSMVIQLVPKERKGRGLLIDLLQGSTYVVEIGSTARAASSACTQQLVYLKWESSKDSARANMLHVY